ncbi:MAG TPA: hypothetical protein VIT42_16595 [Microlunatus sp.]
MGFLLAGLLAFTIREQTVVSVVAVTAGAFVTRGIGRRFRIELAAGTAVLIGVCAVLERLRRQMSHAGVPPYGFDTLDFGRLPPTLLPCLFTIGLAVSPLALRNVLTLRRRDLLDGGRIIGWLLGLLALGTVAKWDFSTFPTMILTNYLTPWGAFPSAVVGQLPPVMSTGSWQVLQVLAMLGGVCIAGETGARLRRMRSIWQGWRSGDTAALIMTIYTLLLIAFVVGLSFGGQRQFDRYLISLFPGIGLLLLRQLPVGRVLPLRGALLGGTVGGAAAFLAAMSLSVTISVNVRDAAFWDAATALTARGVRPTTINAGFAWNGYHASTALDRDGGLGLRQAYRGQHWTYSFPRSRDCHVITVSQMAGKDWRLVQRASYASYGPPGTTLTTYTYRYRPCRARDNGR